MYDLCPECKNEAGVKCSKGCTNLTSDQWHNAGVRAEAMCLTFNIGGNNNSEWVKSRDAYSINISGHRFAATIYKDKWTLFMNQRVLCTKESLDACKETTSKIMELLK